MRSYTTITAEKKSFELQAGEQLLAMVVLILPIAYTGLFYMIP